MVFLDKKSVVSDSSKLTPQEKVGKVKLKHNIEDVQKLADVVFDCNEMVSKVTKMI